MAIKEKIQHKSIDELCLDPTNPRLGHRNASRKTSQARVLELMRGFALDELAVSFLESKIFWPQEALIVVKEKLYGKDTQVVVEGNRRLATLMCLRDAIQGKSASRKWSELVKNANFPTPFFQKIPCILADSRDDVAAFLGFRHVTGIKQWGPAEKAAYIANLIERKKMSYVEVMRTIGSKTDPVRRNYIAYRILIQLENLEDEEKVSLEHVEEKFSVLFLSLREKGVQKFLEIDIHAEPKDARKPVPADKLECLADFACWLFGTEKRSPLFTDSRNVGKFAKILDSPNAVEYLHANPDPSFDLACQKAGADEPELIERVKRATDEIEQSLSRIHLHKTSEELQKAVRRFGLGAMELLRKFPKIHDEITKE